MKPNSHKLYEHFDQVDPKQWRWPNFSPAEIACRGTGKLLINEPALDKLQALRARLGKPLIVRSAYRSPEHNRAVDGERRTDYYADKRRVFPPDVEREPGIDYAARAGRYNLGNPIK